MRARARSCEHGGVRERLRARTRACMCAECARASACEVFERISILFNALDDLCREFQMTKIETIGDAYWCAVGLEAEADPLDAVRSFF